MVVDTYTYECGVPLICIYLYNFWKRAMPSFENFNGLFQNFLLTANETANCCYEMS